MCRIAAYVGPARPLSLLTHAGAHSLCVQSYRPREMQEALLNADGAGIAWFPGDGDSAPCLYRVAQPIWSDENLARLAPRVCAPVQLAVVRSATPGLSVQPSSTPPFVHRGIAFAHNGFLERFRSAFMRPLRERMTDAAYELVVGGTDTEHVFALVAQDLPENAALSELSAALVRTAREVCRIAEERGARAVLNLAAATEEGVAALRLASRGPAPSLYFAANAAGAEEGVLVASEPLFADSAWLPVPERTLLVARRGMRVEQSSIDS